MPWLYYFNANDELLIFDFSFLFYEMVNYHKLIIYNSLLFSNVVSLTIFLGLAKDNFITIFFFFDVKIIINF